MKRFFCVLLVMLFALSAMACSKETEKNSEKIYYISIDKMSIVPVEYSYKNRGTNAMINEAFSMLCSETSDVEYMKTIPSGVDIVEYKIDGSDLSLYLSADYLSLDEYTEILVRSAIVKTLVQIPGVDSVAFYVDEIPLSDASGNIVGTMTADSFIDDFGSETESLLSGDFKLYFASSDGLSVVPETRQVYYSRNVAIEKVILEQLIKGPNADGMISSLPAGTMVNSVSVTDGICYVNFDASIETSVTGVTENVTIYSIVNSLTELDNIKQVQILVKGETPHITVPDIDLSKPISKNENIINTKIKEEEENSWEEEGE